MDNNIDYLRILGAISNHVAPANGSGDSQLRRPAAAIHRETTDAQSQSLRYSLAPHAGAALASAISLPNRRPEPLTASSLANLAMLMQQARRPTTGPTISNIGNLGAHPLVEHQRSFVGGTPWRPLMSDAPFLDHQPRHISMPLANPSTSIPNSRRVAFEEELILLTAQRINAERMLKSVQAEAEFRQTIQPLFRSREASLPPRTLPLSTRFPAQMMGETPVMVMGHPGRSTVSGLRSSEKMTLAQILVSSGENNVSRPRATAASTVDLPRFLLLQKDRGDRNNERSDTGMGVPNDSMESQSNDDEACNESSASLVAELDAPPSKIAAPEVPTSSQASDAESKMESENELPATLRLPSDGGVLNEMHCFLRKHCMGLFFATEADLVVMGKGARPSKVNQVGLRCIHCAHVPRDDQARQSVCYPTKVQSIFESVRNFQRVHMASCPYLPEEIKSRFQEILERVELHKTPQKLVKAYYARSAIELGLRDTPLGLEFVGRPKNSKPLSSLSISELIEPLHEASSSAKDKSMEMGKFEGIVTPATREVILQARKESTPFVLPHDFPSVSDLIFLLFHQLLPYTPTPATFKRRGLKYDPNHPTPGLCCKYCLCAREGENNSFNKGMYFPQTVGSMGDSSFSQTLLTHLAGCPNVPQPVKNAFDELYCLAKANNVSEARGAKKKFMKKIWKRMVSYCEKKQEKLSTNNSKPN